MTWWQDAFKLIVIGLHNGKVALEGADVLLLDGEQGRIFVNLAGENALALLDVLGGRQVFEEGHINAELLDELFPRSQGVGTLAHLLKLLQTGVHLVDDVHFFG